MRGIKLIIMCVALVMSVGVAMVVSQLVSGGTDWGHEMGTVARPGAPATGETPLDAGSALATPDRPASPPTLTGQLIVRPRSHDTAGDRPASPPTLTGHAPNVATPAP